MGVRYTAVVALRGIDSPQAATPALLAALKDKDAEIRGLQVGGRMVGVITHVPELKDEFEQRVVVCKDGCTSQIRLEGA